MLASSEKTNPLLNFYLPCAVSGLLLAGLIAITDPAPSDVDVPLPSVSLAAR
jgi:hypothetical protein